MTSKRVRITALVLAALMLCGTLMGLLGTTARAASDPIVGEVDSIMLTGDGNTNIRSLTKDRRYTIQFVYQQDISALGLGEAQADGKITDIGSIKSLKYTLPTSDNAFEKYSSNTDLKLEIINISDGIATIEGTVSNAKCRNTNRSYLVLNITSGTTTSGNEYRSDGDVKIYLDSYLEGNSGIDIGGNDDDTNPYKSDIIVENIYFTDASGERIDKVDKDTPTFNLVIIYADYGLREVNTDEFKDDRSLDVYLTEIGGFSTSAGTKGTLTYLRDTSADAPRFRASFRGITYTGGGNSVSFRVQYDVEGWDVSGTGSAVANNAKEEDDEDKLSPLTPHIIINQYSYGTEQINAGSNFTLNMSVVNTSPDIPLENIVMTIQPYIPENNTSSTTGGLTITSASNTLYIPSLGVGESYSHSIDLRAEPSAAVGSHKVEVEFSFQYVDEVNKNRESSTDKESIAIPVSQVDRFSVDPLTEIPDIMTVGDRDYITLSFVNKGKSTTYNISGTMTSNMHTMPQSVHFGNLEAGASETMDFEITANEPGEMIGEIVLQYEDENANLNEMTIPFSILIDEPWDPGFDDPWGPGGGGFEEEAPEEIKTATIVLCVIGGLLLATPIALYLFKRTRANGIEDLDEDI